MNFYDQHDHEYHAFLALFMRYLLSSILPALALFGCGSQPATPETTTTTTTTTSPPAPISFPALYDPLIESSAFLKPLDPVQRIPIDNDFGNYVGQITRQYSAGYERFADKIVFGMHQTAVYNNCLTRFNLIIITKRPQNKFDLDFASVGTAAPDKVTDALTTLSTFWGITAADIDAFEPTNATSIVDAVQSRLNTSETMIALRVFSADGGQNVVSFDPNFYHVQSAMPQ